MRIRKETTGLMLDGFPIDRITMENDRGIQVSLLSVGCVIEKLLVPDKHGNSENIVLGYESLEDYVSNADYFGSIVGRTAGRISDGTFTLEGTTYELEKNENGYSLHAGSAGLQSKNWTTEIMENEDRVTTVFTHESPDGEGGYPGRVKLKVTYTLTNDNELILLYEGITDKTTVLNMTNHSYFNLSGNLNKQVFDHKLLINAEQFVPIQENGCPVGLLAGVDGTAFDFRKEKTVGQDIGANETQIMRGGGFDHPFLLEKSKAAQIHLTHGESGRSMSVWTDQDGVVVYTANHLDHKAICLETQNLPDHVNKKGFPFEAITPEKPYCAKTVFKFDVI